MTNEYVNLKAWLEETKDVPLEKMNSFFDARIGLYEDVMSKWTKHYEWMAELVDAKTEKLLDIGCGSGLELDYIFKKIPNLAVTGVDFSEEMLAKLKSKHGEKDLIIVNADYFATEFGTEVYDMAISFETLHHFPAEKKTIVFEKIQRSLKKGGVYLECDYIAISPQIEELVFTELARRKTRDKIDKDTFVHFDTPLTVENEMQAMKNAGFSQVELLGFLEGDYNTAMIKCVK